MRMCIHKPPAGAHMRHWACPVRNRPLTLHNTGTVIYLGLSCLSLHSPSVAREQITFASGVAATETLTAYEASVPFCDLPDHG